MSGFTNAIGAPAGDPTATQQSFTVATVGQTTRTAIDCTGYQTVVVVTELVDDADSYLTEVGFTENGQTWYADPVRVVAQQCAGAGSMAAFSGGLNRPEASCMVVPITGKYLTISGRPFTDYGAAAPANPARITYILSTRPAEVVRAFNAGRFAPATFGTVRYTPGVNAFFWSGTLTVSGGAHFDESAYPPCGAGLAELSVRCSNATDAQVSFGLADAQLPASTTGGQLCGVVQQNRSSSVDTYTVNNIGRRPVRLYIRNYSGAVTVPFIMCLTWEAT